MVIVRDFKKYRYNLLEHGSGIIDNESQNKDTSSNITQAIKAAKRFNELRESSKLSPKVISELQTERDKKGDGFEKF